MLLHVLRVAGICISFSFVWYEIYTAGNDKNKLYLTSLKKLTIINYADLLLKLFVNLDFNQASMILKFKVRQILWNYK